MLQNNQFKGRSVKILNIKWFISSFDPSWLEDMWMRFWELINKGWRSYGFQTTIKWRFQPRWNINPQNQTTRLGQFCGVLGLSNILKRTPITIKTKHHPEQNKSEQWHVLWWQQQMHYRQQTTTEILPTRV